MKIDKIKVGTYVSPHGVKITVHEITGYSKASTVFYSFNDEKETNWGYYESILAHFRCFGFKYASPDWD